MAAVTFNGRIEARMTVPSAITVSATNAGGGPTTVTLTAGTYYPTTLIAQFVSDLNTQRAGATWSGSLSTSTGLVTLGCTGTWSLTWTSTTLRDILGHTGNYASVSADQTGSKQARGLWFPDCPFNAEIGPKRAPRISDLRTVATPTGVVYGHAGNAFYRHRNVSYSHVPINRVWESEVGSSNASWEYFIKETQHGATSSWYGPASFVKIYDLNGNLLGVDQSVAAWQMTGVREIAPERVGDGAEQYYRIVIPELTSAG